MSYINKIFSRANIQSIRSFLLDGVESTIDTRSYEERMDEKHNKLFEKIKKNCSKQNDNFDEWENLIYQYINEVQDVYMEIGLQIGCILTAQVNENIIKLRNAHRD